MDNTPADWRAFVAEASRQLWAATWKPTLGAKRERSGFVLNNAKTMLSAVHIN